MFPKPPKGKENESCFCAAEPEQQQQQQYDSLVWEDAKVVGVRVTYWTEDGDAAGTVDVKFPHHIELGDTAFDASQFEFKVHQIILLMTGDLMYLSTIHGKEHMAGKRCIYCMSKNADWKKKRMCEKSRGGCTCGNAPCTNWKELWTPDKLLELTKKAEELGCHVEGVSKMPLTLSDFMRIIPPVLHLPLGLGNDLWDLFEEIATRWSPFSDEEQKLRKEIMEHKRAKRIAEGARALLLQDQSKQAKKMREQKKKVKELSKTAKKAGQI